MQRYFTKLIILFAALFDRTSSFVVDLKISVIKTRESKLFSFGKLQNLIKKKPSNVKITQIEAPEQLFDFINQDERLCIVKYYAPWCKTCQKMDIRFRKLVNLLGDKIDSNNGNIVQNGKIKFADVNIQTNKKLFHRMNIKRLPYIQIYNSDGLVEEFSCGPKNFRSLVEKVEFYLSNDICYKNYDNNQKSDMSFKGLLP